MNQALAGIDFGSVVPAVIATGIVNSLASFSQPSGNQTADGSPDGLYTPVAGLQNIVCMSAVTSNGRIAANEKISAEMIESDNSSHVWLAGYYPTLAGNTQYIVAVDGVTYRVLGAESDSQMQTTRVLIEVITI